MSTPTKIATRLKSAITGEEFFIGTVGTQEKVSVLLSAPSSVDWTQYSVVVQNISQTGSQTLNLTSEASGATTVGVCTFNIPMGVIYEVQLPTITGYISPINQRFSATSAMRQLIHEYTAEGEKFEQVTILASFASAGGTVALLENMTVIALCTDGTSYSGMFNASGMCTITNIPYGKTYTIQYPDVISSDGSIPFHHDRNNEQFTAGEPSRMLNVTYYEGIIGIHGVDRYGNLLSLEEIESGITNGTMVASDIIAGYYNDSRLSQSTRGDGSGIGNAVVWSVWDNKMGGSWMNPNGSTVNGVPLDSSEGYHLDKSRCAGKYYTLLISDYATSNSYASIIKDCTARTIRAQKLYAVYNDIVYRQVEYSDNQWKSVTETQVIVYTHDSITNLNGVTGVTFYSTAQGATDEDSSDIAFTADVLNSAATKNGFTGSYAQMKGMADNWANNTTNPGAYTAYRLYKALGIETKITSASSNATSHNIRNDVWWTSCQNSSPYGVSLFNGRFSGVSKTYSSSVLVLFDPFE
jgi:hypothetical protein